MKEKMRVFFDLDGVLVDFDGGMQKAHNRTIDFPVNQQRPFYIESVWGLTAEEFWQPTHTIEFWSGLQWTHDGQALIEVVREFVPDKNIGVLSSPALHPTCAGGKLKWVATHMPWVRSRTFIGSRKDFLAHQNAILLEDNEDKYNRFIKAGGHSILVPRHWNSNYQHANNTVQYVREQMQTIMQTAPGLLVGAGLT